MKYYPIVQIVCRAPASWYGPLFGQFSSAAFDLTNQSMTFQYVSTFLCAATITSTGIGYFIIFAYSNPGVSQLLKSCCVEMGYTLGLLRRPVQTDIDFDIPSYLDSMRGNPSMRPSSVRSVRVPFPITATELSFAEAVSLRLSTGAHSQQREQGQVVNFDSYRAQGELSNHLAVYNTSFHTPEDIESCTVDSEIEDDLEFSNENTPRNSISKPIRQSSVGEKGKNIEFSQPNRVLVEPEMAYPGTNHSVSDVSSLGSIAGGGSGSNANDHCSEIELSSSGNSTPRESKHSQAGELARGSTGTDSGSLHDFPGESRNTGNLPHFQDSDFPAVLIDYNDLDENDLSKEIERMYPSQNDSNVISSTLTPIINKIFNHRA